MRRIRFRVVAAVGGSALLLVGVLLWNSTDHVGLERVRTISLPGRGFRVALSSQAETLALLNWNDTWIYDAVTGAPIKSLKNPPGHSLGVIALSSSVDRLAVAGGEGTLRLFQLSDGSPVWSQERIPLQFSDVRFFPSGRRLAVSDGIWHEPEDNGGAIRIYDVADGTLQATIGSLPHSPMGLAISPDEAWLCARLNYGGQVHVWTLPDLREVRRFGFCASARGNVKDSIATSLDISHDGTFVAVGGEGAFGIWRLETGEQLLAVKSPNQNCDVRFHPSELALYAVTPASIQTWHWEGNRFVQRLVTPVRLKVQWFNFAEDAPLLCLQQETTLTLYRLPGLPAQK